MLLISYILRLILIMSNRGYMTTYLLKREALKEVLTGKSRRFIDFNGDKVMSLTFNVENSQRLIRRRNFHSQFTGTVVIKGLKLFFVCSKILFSVETELAL